MLVDRAAPASLGEERGGGAPPRRARRACAACVMKDTELEMLSKSAFREVIPRASLSP